MCLLNNPGKHMCMLKWNDRWLSIIARKCRIADYFTGTVLRSMFATKNNHRALRRVYEWTAKTGLPTLLEICIKKQRWQIHGVRRDCDCEEVCDCHRWQHAQKCSGSGWTLLYSIRLSCANIVSLCMEAWTLDALTPVIDSPTKFTVIATGSVTATAPSFTVCEVLVGRDYGKCQPNTVTRRRPFRQADNRLEETASILLKQIESQNGQC